MSRRWLLSLLCLLLALAFALRPTSATGELKIDEARTRVLFQDQKIEVLLTVDDSSAESGNCEIRVELLDPHGRVRASAQQIQFVGRGNQMLHLFLPFDLSKLKEADRNQIIWYRLHYRVSGDASSPGTEGIVSLSQITPDLFEVRVATGGIAHEGMRYRARVEAIHPLTRKPAANVRVEAVLTLETDDEGNGVKVPAAALTDSTGYAKLYFDLPVRFPIFPHGIRPAGGSMKITARRGGLVAEAENQVLVDQFARFILSTDKPLYQPGQRLHLRALVLSPTKHALSNQDVIFKIEDPEDTNVFRETTKTSHFGIASVDWPIPDNMRLGDYRVKVAFADGDDSEQARITVRISRYDLPNFLVKVQPDHPYYLRGQSAEVKVSADYLFGQPVARGHVRVVRESGHEWNYREQKWDIEEGDKYEGETDANGTFLAHIKLASDDLSDDEGYRRYRDIRYAAYFTDPTTNRTEQRHFDLRITKEPIHIYVIRVDDHYAAQSSKVPLRFYVSTSYADGTPASCHVSLRLNNDKKSLDRPNAHDPWRTTLRTNRYGLAKVIGLRLPPDWADDDVDLQIVARDVRGRTGSGKEEFLRDEEEEQLQVETDKSLYRDGDPITVSVVSSIPNARAVIDVVRDAVVLNSQTVRLHGGLGSLTIPYKPDFKDRLTIAAYVDFADTQNLISVRTVLYPRNHDLQVGAQPLAKSYRPGDEAQVNFRVRGPKGEAATSALGLVITDEAVDERFRTDGEFGNRLYGFYGSMRDVVGSGEQLAGFTLRDLEHLDMSRQVPPEKELVAEVLLNQSRYYYPEFFDTDKYQLDQSKVFSAPVKSSLDPVASALARYAKTGEYPSTEAVLRKMLVEAGVYFDGLRDPWGNPYRPVFFVDKQSDVLSFSCAGADKQFDTDDDFSIERARWAYFRPVGETIDQAVRQFHKRTGGFIRDFATLRSEVEKAGVELESMRDRWDHSYRFDFEIAGTNYVLKVNSSGPDKQFRHEQGYRSDDFTIWTSTIDYFAEARSQIDSALSAQLHQTKRFPRNESDLIADVSKSGVDLNRVKDPWGRACYAVFSEQSFFGDRVTIETRAKYGENAKERTEIKPVTQLAIVLKLRSAGADGKQGTADDFDLATFSGVIAEQSGSDANAKSVATTVGFVGDTGAILGVVTDPNGATVPNAIVSAKNVSADGVFETKSDDAGKYLLRNLPPGMYEVRTAVAGFKASVVTGVPVSSSNITEVNFRLELGQTTEVVNVTAENPAIQTSSGERSDTLTAKQLTILRDPRIIAVTKSGSKDLQITTPRLREYFPETLLWQPSLETDKQGRASINFKLADNITTWKLSVIGSTEDGEIGTAEKEIRAFQPFFVEHDPPKVLTEGDEISLPVVVRNYLERAQNVDLEIKPESWFTLLGPAHKRAQVAAGDAVRETFDFRAVASVKDGKQRITAKGGDDSDTIEKPVTVHPDGEELAATASDIVGDDATLNLNLPAETIANSARAELKIYPNLMAHVMESVEAIMERPYGCGEQTISSTYPSLLVLRQYKRAATRSREESESDVQPPATAGGSDSRARAQRYLQAGYDRLLNYRAESGGFTYWGRGEADLALTAYALRFLIHASGLIAVDQKVIDEARGWVIKQQRADGSWPAHYYWTNEEDRRRTALVTAYIARVLAATQSNVSGAKKDATDKNAGDATVALQRALDYLSARSAEIDEPYLLASYVLAALDAGVPARASTAIGKLKTLAHEENGASYWALETNTPFYGWGLAGRVETTALVVQARSQFGRWSEPPAIAGGLSGRSTVPNTNGQSSETAAADRMSALPAKALKGTEKVLTPTIAADAPTDAATPATTAPTNQTNGRLIRSGLLFLLKQKDRYGVWYSTQATINVLDALLTLLGNTTAHDEAAATAQLIVNGHNSQSIELPSANKLVSPITVDLTSLLQVGHNHIEVRRPAGSPFASAQAVVNYYVPWSASTASPSSTSDAPRNAHASASSRLRLVAKFDKTDAKVSDEITCHVEAERIGFSGYGMLLAEIGLPPGADVDRATLETAMKNSGWSISQYDVLPDRVVVYLWPPAGGVKFDFKFRPRFGLKAKTAPSVIYDYYNPEARTVVTPVLFTIK